MRILLTNDDGIDSVGLHVLARAMRPFGEVVIAAPDREFSGAGAALGALHLIQPEVHRAHVDGIDEAWAVTGPPALCVMFSRLGAFGAPFDLVVSGINPGANVGRSVYHSGTVGAAPVQNIGAYGQELSDCLVRLEFLDYETHELAILEAKDLQFGYRDSAIKRGRPGVITWVEFELQDLGGLSRPLY